MTEQNRATLKELGFTRARRNRNLGARVLKEEWENWELIRPGAATVHIGYRPPQTTLDYIAEPYWANISDFHRPPLRMHTFDALIVAIVALTLDPHVTDVADCRL